MRVLFTSQPSLGHWHPLVPLAKALEEAGHEVAFASTAEFCPTIEAQGFRCFLAGREDTEEELQQRRERQRTLSPTEQADATQIYVFSGIRAERSFRDLIGIINSWQVDVIVRENTEYGSSIAAEVTGVPLATYQIVAPRTNISKILEAPMKRLCEMGGVAFRDLEDMFYGKLFLFPRPLSLWNFELALPPTMHTFAYRGFNQSGEEGLPEWAAKLDRERPTVYATLGTVFNFRTDILLAIINGLKDEQVNLVMVLGRDRDPMEFGEQPEHIHVERYIPQELILPYCDMVITHGGSGTMLDALTFGLPLVMIPIGADQPLNSKLCEAAGVAKVIPTDNQTWEAIREAARAVLDDPKYREGAKRIQKEMGELPGLEYVVRLLERLEEERGPILAEKGQS